MPVSEPIAPILVQLRPVLDTALDAVVVIDSDGTVIAWNAVAERTFGWDASEAVGRLMADLIVPPQHKDAHSQGLARYQASGEARVLNQRLEITALHKDGREFPVELSITTAGEPSDTVFVGFLRDISARREVEDALRESEAYTRLLLDSTAEGFYAVDRDGVTTLCNPSFLKMLGFASEADAVGRKLHDVIHHSHPDGSHYPKTDCPIYKCAKFGESAHVADEVFFRIDGSALPVEYWVHPIVRDGELQGAVCTFLDISERKQAQAAIGVARADAEAVATEQEAILGQLAEGVIVTDAAGVISFVNKSASRLHGVAQLDVPPDQYSATYHLFTEEGLPYPPAELPLARAVRGETVEEARWRIHRPDGSRVLAVGSARPVLDEAGRQVGAVLTVRDDTERDSAERLVRENEARLRALTDHLPGGMVYQLSTGADGSERRFLYVSQSHEELTGIAAQAVLDDPSIPYQLIHPDDRPAIAEAEAAAIRDTAPFDVQVRFRRADGAERWCRIVSAPRPQPDGTLIWDGLQIDITDRVQAQLDLQELNHSLERRVEERTAERDRLWTLSEDMLARADYDGRLLAVSPSWSRVLGYSQPQLLTRPYAEIIHPDSLETVGAALNRMRETGQPTRFENRILAADGTWKPIEWTVAPEEDNTHFIAVGRDMSAEKEKERELALAQEQLRQAQKMEAVGHLTGGIAHDFNNLLTVVTGNMDMARRAIAAEDPARAERSIGNALKGAERAAVLTQRLLAFSRRQPLAPKPTDVGRLVTGLSELLERSLGETVQIETVTSAGLWRVEVDPHQLESAILNLAVNARDAMPEGGKLTVEASNTRIGSTYAAAHAEVAPGQYVVICVTDTGEGMPRHIVERAFDPFFTTKVVGKGTGLGLSQVYGFVKQSGGHVKIYSEIGHGTTIKLYLPRLPGMPEEDIAAVPEPAGPGQENETILVVEDDDDVRTFTVESLRELGYRVLEAHDGPSALRLLHRRAEPLQLLLTDVVMPEMSGRELADLAREHQTDLKVLFTTGYARNAIVHGGRLDAGVELLPKPFTYEALAVRVRQLLDNQPTERLLVLHADSEQRLGLSDLVKELGFSVQEAASGREAVGSLRSSGGRFDAVLVDGGTPLLDMIIADVRTVRHDLPILILGGKQGTAESISNDSCIGILAKPYDGPGLQAQLAALRVRCAGAET